MAHGIATNLIVFGRGLDLGPDGNVRGLTRASAARVAAAVAHVAAHADIFAHRWDTGRPGRLVFSGGYPRAAAGMSPPPEPLREGTLMLNRALAERIHGTPLDAYVTTFAEIESGSTLENALFVRQQAYFSGLTFTPDDPLGLVGHAEHMGRIDYFVRKALRLPRSAVQHVPAPGPDEVPRLPEPALYQLTRVAYAGAITPNALRRRERMTITAARMVSRLPKRGAQA